MVEPPGKCCVYRRLYKRVNVKEKSDVTEDILRQGKRLDCHICLTLTQGNNFMVQEVFFVIIVTGSAYLVQCMIK